MKKTFLLVISFIIVITVLSLSLRGLPGNLTEKDFVDENYIASGPLELSPERGRFVLTYSVVEDKSLEFSIPAAKFATPDVAYDNGRYVSLFAPGVSFIVLPGYLIGSLFDASQVGTFAVISLFALANFFLVRSIAIKLGANEPAALVGASAFLFATPAFAYAVSLYQHHLSVFFLLACLFLLFKYNSFISLAAVWILIGSAIIIDYPNAVMFMPVALYAVLQALSVKSNEEGIAFTLRGTKLVSLFFVAIPLALLFTYNLAAFHDPFKLSGTLYSVDSIDEGGNPVTLGNIDGQEVNLFERLESGESPSVQGFFKTRNMLNGFYIHFLSPDRGMLSYAPVALVGLLGAFFLRKKSYTIVILLAISGLNILLYSMWGDPWGGWAFGSRYLIPTYAITGVFLALLITQFQQKKLLYFILSIVLFYGVFVNVIGALTTSKMPPQNQVLQLEQVSGREEKYTVERNIDILANGETKSFIYNTIAHQLVSPQQYVGIIGGIIMLYLFALLFHQIVVYKPPSETERSE